jgi:hypothetical protein
VLRKYSWPLDQIHEKTRVVRENCNFYTRLWLSLQSAVASAQQCAAETWALKINWNGGKLDCCEWCALLLRVCVCVCVCLRPLLSVCALFHCLRFVCIMLCTQTVERERDRGTKHFHWHRERAGGGQWSAVTREQGCGYSQHSIRTLLVLFAVLSTLLIHKREKHESVSQQR